MQQMVLSFGQRAMPKAVTSELFKHWTLCVFTATALMMVPIIEKVMAPMRMAAMAAYGRAVRLLTGTAQTGETPRVKFFSNPFDIFPGWLPVKHLRPMILAACRDLIHQNGLGR